SRLDRRLVDEQDGNVVLDRIDPLALPAFERGAVLDQLHLRLAVRASEDLEQLCVHSHCDDSVLRWFPTYYSSHMRPIVPLALALAFLPGHARAASIQQPETAPTESAGYHFLVARH